MDNHAKTQRPAELALVTDIFWADAREQLDKARRKHAEVHSNHEGYAVIQEEVDEFWDEVKMQVQSDAAMYRELLHVAAMAARTACALRMRINSDNEVKPQ